MLAELPGEDSWNYYANEDGEWQLASDFPTRLKFIGSVVDHCYG
jgi:hypothetical protein